MITAHDAAVQVTDLKCRNDHVEFWSWCSQLPFQKPGQRSLRKKKTADVNFDWSFGIFQSRNSGKCTSLYKSMNKLTFSCQMCLILVEFPGRSQSPSPHPEERPLSTAGSYSVCSSSNKNIRVLSSRAQLLHFPGLAA